MMNVLALCLIFTSLATAGLFTPSPQKPDVAVEEGHKAVVVEFEKDDGDTKISVSPHDGSQQADDRKGYVADAKEKLSTKMEEAKERIKEESSSVLSDNVEREGNQKREAHHRFRPREFVCDAYGRCRHKIASAMGKTAETEVEKAHEAAEVVSGAVGKVKDTVTRTAQRASDKAQEMQESVKDAASGVSDKASDKAQEMKENVKDKAILAEDVVERATDRAKCCGDKVKEEGKKGLKGIFRRGGGALGHMGLAGGGVLHLLGFAAAYGTGLWVTFASSYVLARVLPRHLFAMVQSKIYPLYFKAMASGVGVALLGHLIGQRKTSSQMALLGHLIGQGKTSSQMLQGTNLLGSLVMILVNLMYLEPRATKVMFESMKKEKEEATRKGQATEPGVTETERVTQGKGDSTAAVKPRDNESPPRLLSRLNSYSSWLNAATLMSLTWHLVHLAQYVHNVR